MNYYIQSTEHESQCQGSCCNVNICEFVMFRHLMVQVEHTNYGFLWAGKKGGGVCVLLSSGAVMMQPSKGIIKI